MVKNCTRCKSVTCMIVTVVWHDRFKSIGFCRKIDFCFKMAANRKKYNWTPFIINKIIKRLALFILDNTEVINIYSTSDWHGFMSCKRGIVTALLQVAEFMGNILITPNAMSVFLVYLLLVCQQAERYHMF